MKKTSNRKSAMQGEIRREYRFDYRKSRPNPFCAAHKK
jgi:hypothetical protein